MPDLMSLAKLAVKAALDGGAQFADAEAGERRSLSVEVEKSSLKSARDRSSVSLSVRAIIRGATGAASVDGHSEADALECARRAVEAARLAEPDPDFVRLASAAELPEGFTEVEGLHDPAVASLGTPELIGVAMDETAAACAVDGHVLVKAGAGASSGRSASVNSCGIERLHESSSVSFMIQPTYKDGDDVGSFYDFDQARRLSDFAPAGLGRSAAETAVSFRGAKCAPTGELPVVLGPLAGMSLLGSLACAAGADGIQRGRSFLAGKLGELVASGHVTLLDDAFVPGGLSSGAFDGAGSPRRRVTVVERGVLKRELHGLYTAEKARLKGQPAENTGHGSRWGGTGPTNVLPSLGTKTAAELIAEVEDGIYVNMGGVQPDMVTGDVSASVDFGFMIRGGKLAYPLRNTMLGGTAFEVLGAVDAVSSDFRAEPGLVMPTVRIARMKVASARE